MSGSLGGAGSSAEQGVRRGAQKARRAADSRWVERAARVGFAVNGVIHVLIGALALQVALSGGSGESTDQSGALSTVAEQPFGRVVLWLGVVGFVGLAAWQVSVVTSSAEDAKERAVAGAKTVVYLVLAATVGSFAMGGGSSSSQSSTDATAMLMGAPAGRILVAAVGLAVVGVAGYQVHKGVTKGFLEDLRGGTSGSLGTAVVRLGQAGYVGRGAAFAITGVLFVVAAVREDPEQARGLDGALDALRGQPFGSVLLAVVAVGFVAYGLYSFARARYADL